VKEVIRKLSSLVVILVLSIRLLAQQEAETETIRFSDESFPLSFDIPAGFELSLSEEEPIFVLMTSETGTLRLYSADVLASLAENSAVEEILSDFLVQEAIDETLDPSAVRGLDTEETIFVYEGEDYQAYLLLNADDSSILGILLVEDEFSEEDVVELASSIEIQSINNEPCLVSTDQDRSVRIHVGPGTNRSAIAFLAVGESFLVLGEAEASDGSRWFKLDKNEVAPSSSALETWVAADDVIQEGNCDAIGEAFAPPIIPIISQGNSNAATDTDGETNGDEQDSDNEPRPVVTGTGAVDPNNLGNPVSTISLRDGVYSPPSNPNSFLVIRMSGTIIEEETCYMFQGGASGQCLLTSWRLVGTNIFEARGNYLTVQSPSSYSTHYFFSNGTNSIGFAYWVRESLPEDLTRYSVIENR
jgi:hypothetical protein